MPKRAAALALLLALAACGGGNSGGIDTDSGMNWDTNIEVNTYYHKGKPLECVETGGHSGGISCDWVQYHSQP